MVELFLKYHVFRIAFMLASVWALLLICLKRNIERISHVSEHVIRRMDSRFELPNVEAGP